MLIHALKQRTVFQRPDDPFGSFDTGNGNEEPSSDALIDDVIKQSDRNDEDVSDTTQDTGGTTQTDGETPSGSEPNQQEDQQSSQGNQTPQQDTWDGEGKPDFRGQDVTFRDGSKITGGAARRMFTKFEKAYNEAQQLREQTRELEQRAQTAESSSKAYEQAFEQFKQTGMNPNEVQVWSRVGAAYKQDPVKAIQYLVSEAKRSGRDLSALQNMGGTVDTNAISSIIDEKLKPFTERTQQEQQREQARQNAERQINDLVTQYPDARNHFEELDRLLQHDKSLNLETAYLRFRSWMLERGYDPNRPLKEQVQQQPQQRQQSPDQTQARARNNPPPIGRRQSPAATQMQPTYASETDDWDTIINQTLST